MIDEFPFRLRAGRGIVAIFEHHFVQVCRYSAKIQSICVYFCIYIYIHNIICVYFVYIYIFIIEGSFNSKLPTIWRVEKQMKSR